MAIIKRKLQILHRPPSPHGFFTGQNGHQMLARVTFLFGVRVRIKMLDEEDVPHWHYVQQRTLGLSEWRSRLIEAQEKRRQVCPLCVRKGGEHNPHCQYVGVPYRIAVKSYFGLADIAHERMMAEEWMKEHPERLKINFADLEAPDLPA